MVLFQLKDFQRKIMCFFTYLHKMTLDKRRWIEISSFQPEYYKSSKIVQENVTYKVLVIIPTRCKTCKTRNIFSDVMPK